MAFFVNGKVAWLDHTLTRARIGLAFLLDQQGHDLVQREIHVSVVVCLTGNDQRRACLIDQYGVHFVNDGKVQPTLNPISHFVDHVVTQVVEAVFVVGAVGDICAICRLLFFSGHRGQIDANGQSQEVIQLAHPLCITTGQVIVHRNDMNAFPSQRIQIHRQGCGQGLAFACAHFRNLALMQSHTADKLHIKVAHLHNPL